MDNKFIFILSGCHLTHFRGERILVDRHLYFNQNIQDRSFLIIQLLVLFHYYNKLSKENYFIYSNQYSEITQTQNIEKKKNITCQQHII